MDNTFRVAWIVSTPTPYKLPLFAKMHAHPGFDIRFLFMAKSDPQRPWKMDDFKINYRILPGIGIRNSFKRRSYTRFNPGIIGELRKGRFNAVVICGYDHITTLLALFYCLLSRTPFFMWGESHILKQRGSLKQRLKRWFLFPLLRRCKTALVTGTIARKYWEDVGIPQDQIFVVANTPDVDFFIRESDRRGPDRDKIRESLNLDERPLGIFVGRFVVAKAVDVLLRALVSMDPHRRPQLLLVGDGPLKSDMEILVSTHSLPVTFIGFQQKDSLPGLYAAADFFVLPSRHEPWGVVVNEAMACSLPLLLSDSVGAAYDLLDDGKNGFMVSTEDVDAWADALTRMVTLSSGKREEMGKVSRRIIAGWTHVRSVENFVLALKTVPEYLTVNQ